MVNLDGEFCTPSARYSICSSSFSASLCLCGESCFFGDGVSRATLPRKMYSLGGPSLRRRRPLPVVRRFLLALPHGRILAGAGQQVAMPAALGDAAVLQHDDLVGVDHGGEAVGDDERRAVGRDLAQALLDFLLGVGVERRGGLV